jgi:hypothetical protein
MIFGQKQLQEFFPEDGRHIWHLFWARLAPVDHEEAESYVSVGRPARDGTFWGPCYDF